MEGATKHFRYTAFNNHEKLPEKCYHFASKGTAVFHVYARKLLIPCPCKEF